MILFVMAGCGKGGDEGGGGGSPAIEPQNTAPAIISAPERFAKTALLYEYQVLAIDPDGDRLSYQLVVGPDGMTLDETTGLLRWPSPVSHGGSHSVELSVTDGESDIKQSFDINVERKEVIAERLILAQEGGVLEVTDPANAFWGLSVEIPAGVLAENSTISVFDISDPNYLPTGSHAIEIIAHTTTGSISPSAKISARKIRSAAEPPGIRIRITYTDQWLQTNNLQDNQLGIYREHIIPGCDTIAFDLVNCAPQPPDGRIPNRPPEVTYLRIDDATHEPQLNSFTFTVNSLSHLGSRYFVGTDGLKSAVGPRYFEIVKGEIASFREDQSTSLILLHGVCASSNDFRGPDDWKEFFRKHHYRNILFFNYPWQERVVDNANALIQFVKALGLNETAKFDIIAHSMGGMVSRAAIEGSEQYNIRNQVRHLFMVGTPNFGVPEPGLEEMLFRLGCGVKASKAAGTRDLIKELSIFLPDINRPGISSRRSGAYHLYTAKTSHFGTCTGVTLIIDPTRCAGHDDRDGDRWSDHINVFGLTTPVDFVPVPNEVELNQLGFDSAKTFDGPNYDHSTLHTDCARNGVCEEVLRRVTGQPPVTTTPPPIFTLNISPGGTGSGIVSGTGISCPGDCSQTYPSGTHVTLTASPVSGSVFDGWNGCTSSTANSDGSSATCDIIMTADKSVAVTFNTEVPVTVLLQGMVFNSQSGQGNLGPEGHVTIAELNLSVFVIVREDFSVYSIQGVPVGRSYTLNFTDLTGSTVNLTCEIAIPDSATLEVTRSIGGNCTVGTATNPGELVLNLTLSNTPQLTPAMRFSVIELGDLPGGGDIATPHAINDRGEVVGVSSGVSDSNYNGFGFSQATKPFLWTPTDGMRELGPPPVHPSLGFGPGGGSANGISDIGAITGCLDYGFAGRYVPFVWTDTNGMRPLEVRPDGTEGYIEAGCATAINDNGEVVGDSGGGAFRWTATGGKVSLGILSTNTFAYAVNNSGQVGGIAQIEPCNSSGPLIWNADGQIQGVDLLAYGSPDRMLCHGRITGINDNGVAVGVVGIETIPRTILTIHGFMWSAASGVMDLGELDISVLHNTEARGINNQEQVVGTSNGHAFLWTAENGMQDLNELLDESRAGWELVSALAINNLGQIVGSGIHNGNSRAFLLTPLPGG